MSSGTSSTSTSSTAPSWQLPYQENALNQAQAQYDSVSSPTQLVAPLSTQQNQAITGVTNLATNGSPEENAANSYVTNTLNGSPANNPYLNSEFTQGANQVQNQIESEFAGSGANVINSLPVQSDELNNLATQLYGGAYNTGVQQQESAAAEAPTLDTQQYTDLGQLNSAGGELQGQAQNLITAPQNFLQTYLNQMNQGTNSVGSTTNTPSTTAQIGSDLTTGSQLASLLFGSSSSGNTAGLLASLAQYL